jgi:hypothetical protein
MKEEEEERKELFSSLLLSFFGLFRDIPPLREQSSSDEQAFTFTTAALRTHTKTTAESLILKRRSGGPFSVQPANWLSLQSQESGVRLKQPALLDWLCRLTCCGLL